MMNVQRRGINGCEGMDSTGLFSNGDETILDG